jgi:hypothetical protein
MTAPRIRRYPVAPLLSLVSHLSSRQAAQIFGVAQSTVQRWSSMPARQIAEWDADMYAVRIGKHPGELWPDWFDISSPIRSNRVVKQR